MDNDRVRMALIAMAAERRRVARAPIRIIPRGAGMLVAMGTGGLPRWLVAMVDTTYLVRDRAVALVTGRSFYLVAMDLIR